MDSSMTKNHSWIYKSMSVATATASSGNKTWIFKRKWAVVSGKHLGRNTHRLGGNSH